MYKLTYGDMAKIQPLFDGWDETLIWACLQGHMGSAWADSPENPKSAQIILGDFCYFAGEPNADLIRNIPSDFVPEDIIMVPQNDSWSRLIEEEYGERAKLDTRFAFKKEPHRFDVQALQANVERLPEEFDLKIIGAEECTLLENADFTKGLFNQFMGYNDFIERGLGFVVTYNGLPVSVASSYSMFTGGIEIEIDTKEEFRRRGLARACVSNLILECLSRGLYPSWDAANKMSADLAESLGYIADGTYPAYIIAVD